MIIILKMDFNLLRARQTIHQKRKETQTQMSTQFRMSKENSTSRAQSRLSRSDQPQGMFTHRSRSQHSMNVDHLTCHLAVDYMNWSRPVIHTHVRRLAKLATGMQTTIGPLLIYFRYHGCIPRLYPVKDNRRLWKKRKLSDFPRK
jgi:hypothetical protein